MTLIRSARSYRMRDTAIALIVVALIVLAGIPVVDWLRGI